MSGGDLSLLDTAPSNLPILDQKKLALLQLVVGSEHAPAIATGKNTHEPGLRFTAQLVRHGCDDDAIINIFRALLPENYEGNSLDEIGGWIESTRKKKFDRSEPGEFSKKATAAERLAALFDRSGATLFHDEAKRSYMSVPVGEKGVRHIALRSSEGRLWLTKMFFDAHGKAIGSRPLDEAVNLLEATAWFGAPQCVTYLRVGGSGDKIVVDLGHDDGRSVSIIPAGWHVGFDSEVKLVRSAGFGRLPTPIDTRENLEKLKKLLNLNDTQWVLVLAFILLS